MHEQQPPPTTDDDLKNKQNNNKNVNIIIIADSQLETVLSIHSIRSMCLESSACASFYVCVWVVEKINKIQQTDIFSPAE